MQKGWKRIGLAVVSLGLALALIMGSVVPAKAAPQEKVVKIGLHMVLTGAAADVGRGVAAWIDYIKYINDQGGIDGIKVEAMWEDEGRAPIVQAVSAHKRFKSAGVVVETCVVQGAQEILAPSLERDEIPLVGAYPSPPQITKPMWIFGLIASIQDLAAVSLEWLKATWTEERPPRVGAMFYDHSAGWNDLEGVKWAAKQYGCEFIGYEVVPMLGAIDTSVEWLRLAGKKPDLIHTAWCGASMTTAFKDAARLEIQKQGIVLFDGGQCVDLVESVVGRDVDGWYHTRWTCTREETNIPEVQLIQEVAKRYRGWEPQQITSGTYIGIGWPIIKIAVEGIRLAIEKVGYENLTGRAVRDALASIKDFDMGLAPSGMPRQLITITEEEPFIFRSALVYRFEGTTPKRISNEFFEFPNVWFPTWFKEYKK